MVAVCTGRLKVGCMDARDAVDDVDVDVVEETSWLAGVGRASPEGLIVGSRLDVDGAFSPDGFVIVRHGFVCFKAFGGLVTVETWLWSAVRLPVAAAVIGPNNLNLVCANGPVYVRGFCGFLTIVEGARKVLSGCWLFIVA